MASKTNITWAGQSFGGYFESDGRLQGQETSTTLQCQNNVCPVPVKAPSAALVFLSPQAAQSANPTATQTFATTWYTGKTINTATLPQAVLSTSNGYGGAYFNLIGSTSPGSANAAIGRLVPGLMVVFSIVTGTLLLRRTLAIGVL